MQEDLTNETESPKPETPTLRYDTVPPARKSGKGKKLLLVLILLILLGAAFAGFNLIKGKQTPTEEITPTPTPTEEITSTPTPATETSPTPTVKPTATPTKKPTKNLTIKVLNGSGVTGAAKLASDYLTGLGYEITSTGNADNENFENTTIQIKPDKQTLLDQLKIDLSTKYTIGTTSADLSSTSSSDAIVTIGKK